MKQKIMMSKNLKPQTNEEDHKFVSYSSADFKSKDAGVYGYCEKRPTPEMLRKYPYSIEEDEKTLIDR